MAKDPAVLFYTSDFITGTLTMSDAQRGKYIILLCLQHQQGFLTEDDMLNICKTYDDKIYSKFIKNSEGLYFNNRMLLETEKRSKYSNSRRNNRLRKGDNISKSYVKHMENENINVNKSLNVPFDIFWNLYDKKKGSKDNCEKIWNKLNDETRKKIIDTLPKFKASITDKQFQPFPQTYLNQKRWNDEINENNVIPTFGIPGQDITKIR